MRVVLASVRQKSSHKAFIGRSAYLAGGGPKRWQRSHTFSVSWFFPDLSPGGAEVLVVIEPRGDEKVNRERDGDYRHRVQVKYPQDHNARGELHREKGQDRIAPRKDARETGPAWKALVMNA